MQTDAERDDDEQQPATILSQADNVTPNPSIVGIIHLVPISSSTLATESASSSSKTLDSSTQTTSTSNLDQNASQDTNVDDANTSNKVIKILFPNSKQTNNATKRQRDSNSTAQSSQVEGTFYFIFQS